MHNLIRKKLDVRVIGAPPLLCWLGGGRHKLQEEGIGRILFAELFSELNFKNGAEIGVDRGGFSVVMLEKNPNLHLTCVDSWEGSRGGEHFIDCHNRLRPYGERVNILREKSMVAARQIPERSLDFVYIDSQRDFNAVMMDLIEWGRKIKPGGLLTGRGYCDYFETGVKKAIDAYTYAHYIRNWYITRDMEPGYIIPITHQT
jgi:hypothetical protein